MSLKFGVIFLIVACFVSDVEAQTKSESALHGRSSTLILGTVFVTCFLLTACVGVIVYRYWGKCSREVEDTYPTIELTPGEEAYPDAKPAFESFDSEMESCSTISLVASPKSMTPKRSLMHGRQGSMHILACINDGFPIDLEDAEDVFFDDYGNVTELNRSVCFDYDDVESSASPEMKSQFPHNKKNVEFQADD